MKKLNKKLQIAITVGALLGMTVLLANCAGSSDPMKPYNLNGQLANKNNQATTQYTCGQPFQMTVLSDKGGNIAQFTEGKSSSIRVQITSLNPNAIIAPLNNDSIKNFPYTNSRPMVSNSGPGLYTITWTPPLGTTSPQSVGESKTFDIVVNSAPNSACAVSQTQTIPLTISKSTLLPEIKKIDFHGKDVNAKEGEIIPFDVTVVDPNYSNGAPLPSLDLVPPPYIKVEAYDGDAAGLIVNDYINQPKELGNGDRMIPASVDRATSNTFIFHKVLDLTKIPLNRDIHGNVDPNSNRVDLCFGVRPISSNQTGAGIPISQCLYVNFAAQAPVVTWSNQDASLTPNEQKTFEFKVSAPMPPSKLAQDADATAKNITSQLKNLNGKENVSCKDDSGSKGGLICDLEWTPTCSAKNKQIPVRFKLDSLLGEDKKTAAVIKYFDIGDADSNCGQSVKATATVKIRGKNEVSKVENKS